MPPQDTWTEVLAGLRPLLEPIFLAYGISPQQAQEMVEEACLVLMSKQPRRQDPEGWLLRRIIERCRKLRNEDEEEGEESGG